LRLLNILKKSISYFSNFIIFFFIDCLLIKKNNSFKENEDILIVRIDGIGDFFIWLNTIKYYKIIYPNRRLTLLCSNAVKSIAEELKIFNEVITIDREKFIKNYKYRYQELKKISKKKYNLLLSPIYSRDFFSLDWLVKSIDAKEKIGFLGDTVNIKGFLKKISNKWYTKLISFNLDSSVELEKNYIFINEISNLKITPKINSILEFIKADKKEINEEYCVLFLGSSNSKRNWEISKFIEIAKKIPKDYKIVLAGGKSETELGKVFLENYNDKRVINKIGKASLLETLFLIKNSNFIIGNETSCIHMAVAAKVKSICILGGGHYGRFLPYAESLFEDKRYNPKIVNHKLECYNCNWHCKYLKITKWPCISKIEVKNVEKALNKILYEEEIEVC
jgi:glycosyl transferase family 9